MDMYVQFIIFVFMMNSLLTNFYNKNAIIYVQHSPKMFYIKHYNIIRALRRQLTSYE